MEIQKSLNEKKNGILTEEEWKGIIFYLYNEEEGDILEKKIISYIQKNKLKNNESIPLNTISEIMQTSSSGMNTNIFQSGKSARFYDNNTNINNSTTYIETHGPKKMTRREMFDLYQFSEDLHIFYKHFINVIGEYQIKLREKYLKNFVKLFRKHDTDLDGVLNENEFINLIKDIPFCQNNLDEFIFKFLSVIDPFDNKPYEVIEYVLSASKLFYNKKTGITKLLGSNLSVYMENESPMANDACWVLKLLIFKEIAETFKI
jgi:Ca2+-binding EF-hand superfamily protein